MDKKQLVQQVLERMEKAAVSIGERAKLRADDHYWQNYPDGHYRLGDSVIVEEDLACLDENSLQKILDGDDIPAGIGYKDLWQMWGQQGCFKCTPTILTQGCEAPVLRIRHDSYLHLHWMRGDCFQDSSDAHCNGTNGRSPITLAVDISAACRVWYRYTQEEREEWERKWALFRKAMIIHHPFTACARHKTFYTMLDKYPEIFEEFIDLTDENVLHMHLDKSLTLDAMRAACAGEKYECPTVLELALMRNDEECCGILRFGETAVSFSWCENGVPRTSAINFPAFAEDAYFRSPPLSPRLYVQHCWFGLAVTLMSLAGVSVSFWRCVPRKGSNFDVIDACAFGADRRVSGWNYIHDKCSAAAQRYPDFPAWMRF